MLYLRSFQLEDNQHQSGSNWVAILEPADSRCESKHCIALTKKLITVTTKHAYRSCWFPMVDVWASKYSKIRLLGNVCRFSGSYIDATLWLLISVPPTVFCHRVSEEGWRGLATVTEPDTGWAGECRPQSAHRHGQSSVGDRHYTHIQPVIITNWLVTPQRTMPSIGHGNFCNKTLF